MNIDISIIDAHEQKYHLSCIPSAIEMVLKLTKKVKGNFYDLQECWKNKEGSLGDFHQKTIHGLIFESKYRLPRDSNFPLPSLFDDIDNELKLERYVIISLLMQNGRYHMYVIYDNNNGHYLAFSKKYKDTIYLKGSELKDNVIQIKGTDILVYKEQGADAA